MQNLDRGASPHAAINPPSRIPLRTAFTLVEMLVAMSLTLLMMAAVIAVFSTVSENVANRRAGIEMSTAMRHARSVLQDDLDNLTCPAIPWTRPESNHGYLEIVEGPQCDFDPSIWLTDENNDGVPDPIGPSGDPLQLDLSISQLPSSNLYRLPGSTADVKSPTAPGAAPGVTDGGGLGDWDDVLMLTARNEKKPFVGRMPDASTVGDTFDLWGAVELESPLAEVIWFAVENPVEKNKSFYFGEPGFRTVYRRTMLIAPWLDFGYEINGVRTGPGVLRVLPSAIAQGNADQAAAALIEFQEQYDLSVRMQWDPLLDGGRWVIVANTLADLTKRENRTEHHGVAEAASVGSSITGRVRSFPYQSVGSGYVPSGGRALRLQRGPNPRALSRNEAVLPAFDAATGAAVNDNSRPSSSGRNDIQLYQVNNPGSSYGNRPFVMLNNSAAGTQQPTVRAIVNEDGQVAMFTNGLAPLSGDRRGEDVMLSNMLAFDIKVFDPEAPLLAEIPNTGNSDYPGEVVDPGSPAWGEIARQEFGSGSNVQAIAGRGAYVDLGYFDLHAYFAQRNSGMNSWPGAGITGAAALMGDSKLGSVMQAKSDLGTPVTFGSYSFQPYRTYDTWSSSYENNGIDDDADFDNANGIPLQVDEGTDGIDSVAFYDDNRDGVVDPGEIGQRYGVDDPGERETSPPYDTPLRGLQVTLRAYELDSRQIREVNVKQTFVPK